MKPGQTKRQKIYNKYEGRCAYCGEPSTLLTLDHIKPEAQGGTWKIRNLNPACYDCNQAKSDLSVDEFRQEITSRLNPNYAPRLNHKAKRAIKRHPGIKLKLTQPSKWLNTLKKFSLPVVFYFEKDTPKPSQDLLTSVMVLLTPRSDSKPRYYSMGGFGFNTYDI
jgi:hypothetical protein